MNETLFVFIVNELLSQGCSSGVFKEMWCICMNLCLYVCMELLEKCRCSDAGSDSWTYFWYDSGRHFGSHKFDTGYSFSYNEWRGTTVCDLCVKSLSLLSCWKLSVVKGKRLTWRVILTLSWVILVDAIEVSYNAVVYFMFIKEAKYHWRTDRWWWFLWTIPWNSTDL